MTEFPPDPAALLDRLMQTARAALPDSVSTEMRENLRAALQDVILELEVVSREEFDIQNAVLQKTRAKVDEMEAIIADLEARLNI